MAAAPEVHVPPITSEAGQPKENQEANKGSNPSWASDDNSLNVPMVKKQEELIPITSGPSTINTKREQKSRIPIPDCNNYKKVGFCLKGTACRFHHDYKRPLDNQFFRFQFDIWTDQLNDTQKMVRKVLSDNKKLMDENRKLQRAIYEIQQGIRDLGVPRRNMERGYRQDSQRPRARSQSRSRLDQRSINERLK